MSDIDVAFERLRGLIGSQNPHDIMLFSRAGAPVSQARAHVVEASYIAHFRRLMKGQPAFTTSIAIVALFFRPNRQRIDADNMMKVVMDAGTKAGVWRDDCQVAAQTSIVGLDVDKPRTVVALCPYESTLDRRPNKFVCPKCGTPFERPEWYARRNATHHRGGMFCSLACARPVGLLSARCPRCNNEFQRKSAGQRYCSLLCAHRDRGQRLPNGEQRPPAVCEKCGNRVSRREYRQCRACRGYGRPRKS